MCKDVRFDLVKICDESSINRRPSVRRSLERTKRASIGLTCQDPFPPSGHLATAEKKVPWVFHPSQSLYGYQQHLQDTGKRSQCRHQMLNLPMQCLMQAPSMYIEDTQQSSRPAPTDASLIRLSRKGPLTSDRCCGRG